jgi:hypothetical protein
VARALLDTRPMKPAPLPGIDPSSLTRVTGGCGKRDQPPPPPPPQGAGGQPQSGGDQINTVVTINGVEQAQTSRGY